MTGVYNSDKGYVCAEKKKKKKMSINTIPSKKYLKNKIK